MELVKTVDSTSNELKKEPQKVSSKVPKSVKNEKFNDPSENHAREVAVKSENVTSIINVKNPNNEVDVLSVSSDLEGDSYHINSSDSKISKISQILGAETVKNLKNIEKNSHKLSSNIPKNV